ncbi:PQQ-binding-like beta-propeller repeat protein [Streptomyces sp. S-2]|uniref:outer membrane protein assembly factor BamB family protein n=1 Tax=Streptomyces sp. S-2 TaxID=2675217 RepID=UPI001C449C9A|nr:PQQ-binding-like beta-propeller repeat protein [Streptomyces sp. S-2]
MQIRLTALDTGSGTPRWDHFLSDALVTAPVAAGDTVYITAQDGTVQAIDAATGTRNWTVCVGTRVTAPPVIAQDRVFVASHTPWTHHRSSHADRRTSLAEGRLRQRGIRQHALPGGRHGLGCRPDRPTARLEHRYRQTAVGTVPRRAMGRRSPRTPTVTDGVLYFVTRGGDLRALCLT